MAKKRKGKRSNPDKEETKTLYDLIVDNKLVSGYVIAYIDNNKIYRLHESRPGKYMFICDEEIGHTCFEGGMSLKLLLDHMNQIFEMYVFDDYKEFLHWTAIAIS